MSSELDLTPVVQKKRWLIIIVPIIIVAVTIGTNAYLSNINRLRQDINVILSVPGSASQNNCTFDSSIPDINLKTNVSVFDQNNNLLGTDTLGNATANNGLFSTVTPQKNGCEIEVALYSDYLSHSVTGFKVKVGARPEINFPRPTPTADQKNAGIQKIELPFVISKNSPSGLWYPNDYSLFGPNIAWKYAPAGIKCEYGVSGCDAILVVTQYGCPSGLYGEDAEFDSSGTQIGYSNDSLGRTQPGIPARLLFNYNQAGVKKTQIVKIQCN